MKAKWEIVEVKKLITTMDSPELVYRLPSGFPGRTIEVYEDAIETLEVRYVDNERQKSKP